MPAKYKYDDLSMDEARKLLKEKLEYCKRDMEHRHRIFRECEMATFGAHAASARNARADLFHDHGDDVEGGDRLQDVNSSPIYRNVRFVTSQMSANPPATTVSPVTADPEDRRKANAADKTVRHALRTYKLQEYSDQRNVNTVVYGSGFLKSVHDPEAGYPLEIDEKTGDIIMEGDIIYSVPSVFDMYIDPDASNWAEVRYTFERKCVPYDEACTLWPDRKEELKASRKAGSGELYGAVTDDAGVATTDPLGRNDKDNKDVIYYYEYYEKGTKANRFLGGYALLLESGVLLTDGIVKSPHRFKRPGYHLEVAELPYSLLTNIDVPDSPWGKSDVEYALSLQRTRNKLDQVFLESIQANAIARMIVNENTELTEDSIINSAWDIIKITSNQPPFFMQAPSVSPDVSKLREQLDIGIDEAFGINESMLGQSSREVSSFVMQYAANQGNTVRIRLFNKYAMAVEDDYKRHIKLIRRHWDTPRMLSIVGKESAVEVVEIRGTDLAGGFDIVVSYGQSLSLDPITRRQEMMMLAPFFEKAGIPPAQILKMFKLNELEGLHDRLRLSSDRQSEIFEKILGTGVYIPPRKFQDHVNMLAYALDYVMGAEYQTLDESDKRLIEQHIEERMQMAAEEAAPEQPPQGPGMMPQEGGPTEMAPPPPVAGMPDPTM